MRRLSRTLPTGIAVDRRFCDAAFLLFELQHFNVHHSPLISNFNSACESYACEKASNMESRPVPQSFATAASSNVFTFIANMEVSYSYLLLHYQR